MSGWGQGAGYTQQSYGQQGPQGQQVASQQQQQQQQQQQTGLFGYSGNAQQPVQQAQTGFAGGFGSTQAAQPLAGGLQGYNYGATQQSFGQQAQGQQAQGQQAQGQQAQGQQQVGYIPQQTTGYNIYNTQGTVPAKPSAAAQAVQGLAPDQQAKLTQIMAQVQGSSTQSPVISGGYNTAQLGAAQGYQYGSQVSTSQAAQPTAQATPNYGQYGGQTPAVQQGQQSAVGYSAQQPTAQSSYSAQHATPAFGAQQPVQGAAQSFVNEQANTPQAGGGYAAPQQTTNFGLQQAAYAASQQQTVTGYGGAVQQSATPNYGSLQQATFSQAQVQQPQVLQQQSYSTGFGSTPTPLQSSQQQPTYTPQQSTPAFGQAAAQKPAASYQQTAATGFNQSARPSGFNQSGQYGRSQPAQPSTQKNNAPFRPAYSANSGGQSPSAYRQQPVQTQTQQASSYGSKPGYGRVSSSGPRPSGPAAPTYPRPSIQPPGGSRFADTRAGSSAGARGGSSAGGNRQHASPAKGRAGFSPAVPAASSGFGQPVTAPSRASLLSASGVPPPPGRAGTGLSRPAERDGPLRGSRGGHANADHGRERELRDRERDRARDKEREKEREREREREREKEKAREKERSARAHRSKEADTPKRERSPPRRAASPRKPPPPEYAVKVANRPYETLERDYMDVVHRYTKLYVPADFAKCVSLWTQEKAKKGTLGCSLIPLDNPATFEHDTDYKTSPHIDNPVVPAKDGVVKYNARVALICGLDAAAQKDLVKGPSSGGSHLHNLLKFLTVRSEKGSTRAGITLLGGPHDLAADGDPARSKKALMNTCIRHAKLALDLDISSCATWIRFLEVHYQRPPPTSHPDSTETAEVTVVFLADASECMPSEEAWPKVWVVQEAWKKGKAAYEAAAKTEQEVKEKQEPDGKGSSAKSEDNAEDNPKDKPKAAKKGKTTPAAADAPADDKPSQGEDLDMTDADAPLLLPEEDREVAKERDEPLEADKAPAEPVLLAKGRLCENKEKWRSACISLDGLLDYDEEDRDEGTLEMNLFAENFSELLARDYGKLILDALYYERSAALRRREQRKRKRDEEDKKTEEEKAKQAKASEYAASKDVKQEHAEKQTDTTGRKGEDASKPADSKVEGKEESREEGKIGMEGDVAIVKAEDGDAEMKAADEKAEPSEPAGEDTASKEEEAEEEEKVSKKPAAKKKAAGRGRGRGRGGRGRGRGKKAASEGEETEEGDKPADKADDKPEGSQEKEEDGQPKQAEDHTYGDIKIEDSIIDEVDKAVKADTEAKVEEMEENKAPEEEKPVKETMDPEDMGKASETSEKTEDPKKEEPKKEKPKKRYTIDEPLMYAFRYFDKTGTGYLKVDDLRRIIHNLGLALSHRTVKDLCVNVAETSSRHRADRIIYRDLYEKEVKEADS